MKQFILLAALAAAPPQQQTLPAPADRPVIAVCGGAANLARQAASAANGSDALYREAVAAATDCIGKGGGSDGLIVRAEAQYALRNSDAAIADESRSLALRADSPTTLYNRAIAYRHKVQYAPALRDLAEAIRRAPSVTYYREQGLILTQQGDDAEAVGAYDSALALAPDDGASLNGACWSRGVVNKELDTALSLCRQGVAVRPKSAATVDSLGFVQFRMNNLAGALASYNAALSLAPKQAGSLYMRGIVKLRLGNKTDGAADLAVAAVLDPGVADTYRRYGVSP